MPTPPTAEEFVTSLAKKVESEVKKRLVGLGGFVIRSQLPQTWTFKIDQEAFSFQMDKQGNVKVSSGLLPEPDVRIETSYERLMINLRSGSPGESPPSTTGVSFGSNRGRRAYFYVRKNLKI